MGISLRKDTSPRNSISGQSKLVFVVSGPAVLRPPVGILPAEAVIVRVGEE